MNRMTFLIMSFVILSIHYCKAQNDESQMNAWRLFSDCLNKNRIYPEGKYAKSYFDNVSLHPIPLFDLVGDSMIVFTRDPYLIIISKDNQYLGVVSSDDVGNSYIDIDFVYSYYGTIKTIWSLMRLLSEKDIKLYNMLGVCDQVVFAKMQNGISYIDFFLSDVGDENMVSTDMFKAYNLDSIPNCGFLPRDARKNSKKNLRYYLIGYR